MFNGPTKAQAAPRRWPRTPCTPRSPQFCPSPDPPWSCPLHIPAAALGALQMLLAALYSNLGFIFTAAPHSTNCKVGAQRGSCWHLKLRGCCKQTNEHSQVTLPTARFCLHCQDCSRWSWTQPWEVLVTPPVLATTQRTQLRACRCGYTRENEMEMERAAPGRVPTARGRLHSIPG